MKFFVKNIMDFDDKTINNFYKSIFKEKRLLIDKIIDENDRKKSIIGEIMLCELLKKEDINYESCSFYKNESGKTYISNYDIYFNISHSDKYIAVAISNKEIGIDIEEYRKYDEKVLKTFANEDEVSYVKNSNRKRIDYIKLYTSKEAYIKCNGLRLLNIKDFTIVHNDKIGIEGFNINNFIADKYVVSVCEKK